MSLCTISNNSVANAISLLPLRRSDRLLKKQSSQGEKVQGTKEQDTRIQEQALTSFAPPQSPIARKQEEGRESPETPKTTPKTKRVRQILQENPSPEKKYGLTENDNGWISLNLTPGVKKATHVIYMFREKSTGKTLVGKTEMTVAKRASGYNSQINHPEKKRGQMPLPTAVRENPEDFEFGILCKAPDDIDLDALEKAYVDLKQSVTHGFNQRNGGGGGRSRKKSKENQDPERVKTVTKSLLDQFQSPQKKPIEKTKKGYKVPFSPKTKKTKNVVYVFKNIKTNERYVGKTIRALNKRISEHMHHAAHPEKDAGKLPLQEAIRENHKDISVGVLYKVPKEEEDLIDEIEKSFIEYYKSNETGYNGNAGGGGG